MKDFVISLHPNIPTYHDDDIKSKFFGRASNAKHFFIGITESQHSRERKRSQKRCGEVSSEFQLHKNTGMVVAWKKEGFLQRRFLVLSLSYIRYIGNEKEILYLSVAIIFHIF